MLWQASCPTCGLHCRFEHSSSDFYRFDYVRALLEALLCEISNLLLKVGRNLGTSLSQTHVADSCYFS